LHRIIFLAETIPYTASVVEVTEKAVAGTGSRLNLEISAARGRRRLFLHEIDRTMITKGFHKAVRMAARPPACVERAATGAER
jgi:hypothetical protein